VVQLNDITNLTNASLTAAQINGNNSKIEGEFDSVVYADGRKALTANLDVNSQRLLNVGSPQNATDAVRLADLQSGLLASSFLIPALTGNNHRILSTDGSTVFWRDEDVINLKRFGTNGAAIQAAVNAAVGKVLEIPAGEYTLDANIVIPSDVTIVAYGAVFKAVVNNQVMFQDSGGASYYTKIFGGVLDGNGYTGVVGFAFDNWRITTVLSHTRFKDMLHGVILNNGSYATLLENLGTERVLYPVRCVANCGGTLIFNPQFDNGPTVLGDSTGVGVAVQAALPKTIGLKILGGYIQGFQYGVADEAIGTNIDGTYFEECLGSDVYALNGCLSPKYENTKHFGGVGPAAFTLRDTDGAKIVDCLMASGARTKLLDLNSTATNTQVELPGNAFGYNSPVGDIDLCNVISAQTEGSFTPIVEGGSSAGTCSYAVQAGKWTKQGDIVLVELEVAWTGHTGTGSILIKGIPGALAPQTYSPRKTGEAIVAGMTVTDPRHYAWFNGTSTQITIVSIAASGTESNLALAAAGTLYIRMHYSV
jgi:hypothetical protein